MIVRDATVNGVVWVFNDVSRRWLRLRTAEWCEHSCAGAISPGWLPDSIAKTLLIMV